MMIFKQTSWTSLRMTARMITMLLWKKSHIYVKCVTHLLGGSQTCINITRNMQNKKQSLDQENDSIKILLLLEKSNMYARYVAKCFGGNKTHLSIVRYTLMKGHINVKFVRSSSKLKYI